MTNVRNRVSRDYKELLGAHKNKPTHHETVLGRAVTQNLSLLSFEQRLQSSGIEFVFISLQLRWRTLFGLQLYRLHLALSHFSVFNFQNHQYIFNCFYFFECNCTSKLFQCN